ncbi:MAG: hypothetical protein ACE5MB_06910 [Anaerolineae bacterium]
MKKNVWFLVLLMTALLLGGAGCGAAPLEWVSSPAQATTTDVGKLRREIQLLNLINGLELSDDQMRFILEKAREAQEIREELRGRAEEKEGDAVGVLSELRATLMRGEEISSDLREQIHLMQSTSRGLKEEYESEMTRLALEIKGVLGEHQLYALEQFVPCLIPPEGEARIGQAEGTAHAERQLARIRAMPSPLFERRKEEIAQRAMELIRRHLPKGTIINEEEEKEWLISFLEEARALSDVEFELEKSSLVEELKSRYTPPRLPVDVSVKIERFLLDPLVIPLLEEKLAMGT